MGAGTAGWKRKERKRLVQWASDHLSAVTFIDAARFTKRSHLSEHATARLTSIGTSARGMKRQGAQ
eukprot:scaffold219138_cov14-Tisochrysis_lutea.AAC.1